MEKLTELSNNLISILKDVNRRVLVITVIISCLVILIAYPYLDANYLCYDRIEKRIANLNSLLQVAGGSLPDHPELQSEYDRIIRSIISFIRRIHPMIKA